MNGLLTKLNIIKNNTLVKKGQLLYNHSSEGLVDSEGNNLPEGLYAVRSAQLIYKASGDSDKKRYYHSLDLISVKCDGVNDLALGSDNYSVSVDAESFKTNFGISKQAKKGVIYEYIKNVFDKAGKEGFDPKVDYDSVVTKIAWSVMHKSPIKVSDDEAEDIILDVLMHIVNEKMVKKFDSSRDFTKYLIGFMYKGMFNYMTTWIRRKTKEVEKEEQESDFTKEEQVDLKRIKDNSESPEKRMDYKDLVKGVKSFMKGRIRGKEQVRVFDDMMAGYSSAEIAKRNNVSPPLISRYTNDIRDSLKAYAEKTDNQDLLVLMAKHSKKRMHSDKDVYFIVKVLNDYKKKYGNSIADREPSGDVKKIKRLYLDDKVSDDVVKNTILSDSYSAKTLKSEMEEYLNLLDEQDEIIESENGKLVGLRIVSDDIRNIKDKAKCKKKKKESKEKGHFVYSRCGFGPHKVLKVDGTFSIKLNRRTPVKIFKSKTQAEKAASRYQHTKLNLCVGLYPDEYLKEGF